jgi:hypothetical protein
MKAEQRENKRDKVKEEKRKDGTEDIAGNVKIQAAE